MKPEDKFGKPIYNRTFEKLLRIGRKLEEIGYRESTKSPNLFYRSITVNFSGIDRDTVGFYADMRGTDVVPIWQNPVPMVYLDKRGLPKWFCNQTMRAEVGLLIEHNIPHRFSFFEGEDAFLNNVDRARTLAEGFEDHMMYSLFELLEEEDGICKVCGRVFQSDGIWCSLECKENLRVSLHDKHVASLEARISKLGECSICGTRLSADSHLIDANDKYELPEVRNYVKHHTSYAEDETMVVCFSCHTKIHLNKDPSMKNYQPKDKIPKRERKYRLVPCRGCAGKARVSIDDGSTTSLCYKCERKETNRRSIPAGRACYHRGFGGTGTYSARVAIRDKFSDR